MAATRAGMRVAAISSGVPRWLDGSAGSGSPRCGGPSFRASAGWSAQPHVHGSLLLPSPDLEHQCVTGLLGLEDITQLRDARDGLPVDGDDDVASDPVGLAGHDHGRRPGPEPGLLARGTAL